uniref:Uncharacterized protein n=1 Tax=Leersia perrieri TaxID=77586 RepID=A0A0D9XHX4_9ORYZ
MRQVLVAMLCSSFKEPDDEELDDDDVQQEAWATAMTNAGKEATHPRIPVLIGKSKQVETQEKTN